MIKSQLLNDWLFSSEANLVTMRFAGLISKGDDEVNPHLALELAEQRQSLLRREYATRLPRVGRARSLSVAASTASLLRRSLGWLLIDLGLRLARPAIGLDAAIEAPPACNCVGG